MSKYLRCQRVAMAQKMVSCALLASLSSTLLGTTALAQPATQQRAAATGEAIEEVVVTAQRREERLQDVPIIVAVLNGEALDRSSNQGIVEALGRVPGVLTFTSATFADTAVQIRGIAPGAGGSSVAFYLDTVPFGLTRSARVPDTNVYDLDRVEVLKGPQGTLYGASAQSGVVRVLTKDANLDEFEFKARVGASKTEEGEGNYRGNVAVNAPLVPGKLAIRAVGGYEAWGGWIDRPIENNANDGKIRNGRFKINALPAEGLSLEASAWISRADFDAEAGSDANYRNTAQVLEPYKEDYEVYGFNVGYELPNFSITSATGYMEFVSDSFLDYASTFGIANSGIRSIQSANVWSQEVNLSSTSEGPWRWSLGGFYRHAESGYFQARIDRQGALNGGYRAPNQSADTSESFAAFGEITRVFMDGQLELTGGLRYFDDKVNVVEFSRQQCPGAPAGLGSCPGQANQAIVPPPFANVTVNFDKISPRAVLTWHPSDDLTTYASYSEGFRSGFPQSPVVIAAAPQFSSVRPDNLRNYELGAKGAVSDQVRFDGAIYFVDWVGIQQTLTVNAGTATNPINLAAPVNGQSASGLGAEAGVTFEPVDRLEIGFSAAWNDLTFDADVISGGIPLFRKGDRIAGSPEYGLIGTLDYAFPLGTGGYEGQFSASGNFTSVKEGRLVVGGVSTIVNTDDMFIARTSFAVVSPKNWTVTAYVDNLTNWYGMPQGNPFGVANWVNRVRPRTFGIQFDYQL